MTTNTWIAWTAKEESRLRDLRAAGLTHRECTALLGRTLSAVKRRCELLAVLGEPRHRLTARTASRLRSLAADGGVHPEESARLLGVGHQTAARWLSRLGLSLPSWQALGRPLVPAGAALTPSERREIEDDVRGTQGSAAAQRHRAACLALGWPEVVRPALARILAALETYGPLTSRELRERAPGRHDNATFWRRLAELLAPLHDPPASGVGMVVRLPPLPGTRGVRYALAPWLAARRAEQREDRQR